MATYSGTAYHADSDADDEFERSVMASPTQLRGDLSDDDTSSEIHSNEHTPTTFDTPFDDGIRPRNVISEWTAEESAHFVASLGLRQYSEQFIQDEIVGEALIALGHDELKELGVNSAGHRLKILKEVYNVKVRQDIPIESDHYTPPSIAAISEQERATKDDVIKLTNAILRLRDERIVQLEQQLTKLADDNRKLRADLWPVFKMVKEREPLPYRPTEGNLVSPEYPPEQLVSPPLPMAETEKQKSSLSRTFSKRLGLGSGVPKNNSPTHIVGAIPENRATHDNNMSGLQPSAAASAASNSLTAGMSGGAAVPHYSPNPNSPTSPMPAIQPLSSRTFQRDLSTAYNTRYDGSEDYRNAIPTPPLTGVTQDPISYRSATTIGNKNTLSNASTLVPNREMSASVPPGSGNSRPAKDSSKESDAADQIFKSFRVALDDPCWKVLPAALRKYNIQADWRQYALYIVYGDQERCVNLEEKPLALFKDLDREGKKPMFMLRKLANGIVADMPAAAQPPPRPGTTGPGAQPSSASIRAMGQDSRMLPGGII